MPIPGVPQIHDFRVGEHLPHLRGEAVPWLEPIVSSQKCGYNVNHFLKEPRNLGFHMKSSNLKSYQIMFKTEHPTWIKQNTFLRQCQPME